MRIASNLRFAMRFSPLKHDSQKKRGFSLGALKRFARIRRFASEGREWGVGSVVVEPAFLGRPDFQSRGPKTLILAGFRAIWGKYLGCPTRRANDRGSNAPFPSDRFADSRESGHLRLCCPCPPRGPENPRNSSRSESRLRGVPESRSKVGQKYRNLCTFDLF